MKDWFGCSSWHVIMTLSRIDAEPFVEVGNSSGKARNIEHVEDNRPTSLPFVGCLSKSKV